MLRDEGDPRETGNAQVFDTYQYLGNRGPRLHDLVPEADSPPATKHDGQDARSPSGVRDHEAPQNQEKRLELEVGHRRDWALARRKSCPGLRQRRTTPASPCCGRPRRASEPRAQTDGPLRPGADQPRRASAWSGATRSMPIWPRNSCRTRSRPRASGWRGCKRPTPGVAVVLELYFFEADEEDYPPDSPWWYRDKKGQKGPVLEGLLQHGREQR